MQHQSEDEESRRIDKTRHNGAGTKTRAVTNTGDYLHGDTHQGNNRNKAVTNLGGNKTKDNGIHQNAKDPTKKLTRNLAKKLAKDLTKGFVKTLTGKLAKMFAKTLTGELAKDLAKTFAKTLIGPAGVKGFN